MDYVAGLGAAVLVKSSTSANLVTLTARGMKLQFVQGSSERPSFRCSRPRHEGHKPWPSSSCRRAIQAEQEWLPTMLTSSRITQKKKRRTLGEGANKHNLHQRMLPEKDKLASAETLKTGPEKIGDSLTVVGWLGHTTECMCQKSWCPV